MKKKDLNFIELILYISRHKKFIFFTVLIASIAAVIYSLLAPKYWKSTASFLPSETEGITSAASISELRSSLVDMGTQPASSELIMIMKSNRLSKKVISNFDLYEYFELNKKDTLKLRDKAIEKLKNEVTSFSLDEETGLVSINVLTKNKYLSANIANYYLKILDKYNKETRMTKSKKTRIFLEKRLNTISVKIDSLSLVLNKFQKNNNILDLQIQTKKTVELYSEIISKKIIKQLNLDIIKIRKKETSPEIKRLEEELQFYNNKIKELEYLDEGVSKYILKMNEIPDMQIKIADLKMNISVLKQVYEFLYPQYETAKIEELRDVKSIEIIDRAEPAGKRSKPRRALNCIITFTIALLLSVFISVVFELTKEYINEEDKKNLLSEIKKNLKK